MRINDRNIQEPVGESLKQMQIQCMLTLHVHTRQTLKNRRGMETCMCFDHFLATMIK